MNRGRCKFCGCTERRGCQIAVVKHLFAPDVPELGREYYVLPSGIALVPPDAQTFMVPCSWLLEDVCSNPACVEKAYAEAVNQWEEFFEAAA
jgi:hypothetical protein